MIEISGVSKNFAALQALNDVSLSVQKGSIYGLVGSNGAGKTTLLKIMAGIYKPDAGKVMIDSLPVYENNSVKMRSVFIPDYLYSFPQHTVNDLAQFHARIYSRWSQERYAKLQPLFNIAGKRRIRTLSKGMQRQLAFWMGLSIQPEVMILDEPLDGLDPVMRQKVKSLVIQDVAEKDMSVIISSHNLRELEDICDHIGILHQGKLLVQQDLDDLKADIHKIQLAFTTDIPAELLTGISVLHQERHGSVIILIVRGAYEEITQRLQTFQPAIMDVLPLTLEEIFIYEMGDNGYEIKNLIS